MPSKLDVFCLGYMEIKEYVLVELLELKKSFNI